MIGYKNSLPVDNPKSNLPILLAIIGCSHGRHLNLDVPNADCLLHTGDYSRRGDKSDAIDFLRWLESQPHRHKVFTNGNHDGYSEDYPREFAELVAQYAPSCHYLCDSGVTIEGLRFWGSPVSPFFLDWWWNRQRGSDIQRHWDKIPGDTQVLVTHGPPLGRLDLIMPEYGADRDLHQGCGNLRTTIDERLKSLRISAFSHLHYQGCQTEIVNGVIYVNGAVVDDGYSLRGDIQVVTL